jgi:hypothetical protein
VSYDWCNPNCPDPCWCQDKIDETVNAMTPEERIKAGYIYPGDRAAVFQEQETP